MYVYMRACQDTNALRSLRRKLYIPKKGGIFIASLTGPVLVFRFEDTAYISSAVMHTSCGGYCDFLFRNC